MNHKLKQVRGNEKTGVYRKGAYAIIVDPTDNMLLIQKKTYSSNDWTLVGGGREEGEDSLAGLLREIKEETGLDKDKMTIIGPSEYKTKYNYPKKLAESIHSGRYIGQEYDNYLVAVSPAKRDFDFSDVEIRVHKWVKISELEQYFHFPGQYLNIICALNDLKKISLN
jgi:8-oxo-dGTP pyrophosphatase MutT (NUDIX family)